MAATALELWKLLAESNLLAPPHLKQLSDEFAAANRGAEPSARTLAQWLVSRKAVTRYQAVVLLAGRSGPFFYGDYKVTDRLESGPLAGTFRAVHIASGHSVSLKFLSGPALGDPQAWDAAQQHSAAAATIVSPFVQRHFAAVDLGKFKFFVGEDLRGPALAEKLNGKLAPPEACRLARLIALGLEAVHAAGRAYGDLRAGNVLLESAGKQQPVSPKLALATPAPPAAIDFADQQPDGRFSLLADYLAPELWTPGRAPDPLTDLYALGCLLYQLLTGAPPFDGGDAQQKFTRHTSEAVRPLEPLGVPQPLAQVVLYLMAKNPSVRYASARLAAEQLAVFVEPAALRTQPPAPPATLAAFERTIVKQLPPQPAPAPPAPFIATAPAASPAPFEFGQPPSTDPAGSLNVQLKSRPRPARSAAEILQAKKKLRQRNLVIGLVLLVLLAAGGGGFGYWWANRPRPAVGDLAGATQHNDAKPAGSSDNEATASDAAMSPATGKAAANPASLVPDDGHTLWASPTAGDPIAFAGAPPEGQAFVFVRPSELIASDEGNRVLTALGPDFAAQREAWERAAGVKLTEIEHVLIAFHNNDGKFPRTSFAVKTKEPLTTEQLLQRWGNPSPARQQDETYYAGPQWAFYIPASAGGQCTFAMGEPRDIQEVAAAKGAPPPTFREMERLRRATDSSRHVTLLFFPQFLFNDDGQPLFAGQRAKARAALAWLLGDHLQAASLSAHFTATSYLEMRMLGSLDKEPHKLTEEIRDRFDALPRKLEDYFVSLDPPPYWKKLAFRFPGMLSELHAQLRLGVENDQAIINAVLPETAPHNLVLGGELLVSTTPGAGAVASAAPAAASGAAPKTIADALQIKTSFSFDNQSLEFAMRDLADDVKGNLRGAPFEFAIKIIGDDLKLDGITRNQSIRDFKQDNQTVADILTALVRKANPVTTVTDPSEADQKLVWLIGPDPDNPANQAVLITTRAAATSKNYQLPPPFLQKQK